MGKGNLIVYELEFVIGEEMVSWKGLVLARNLRSAYRKLRKIYREPRYISLRYANPETPIKDNVIPTEELDLALKQL